MSRSNGPGVPPNGWPGAYPPADPQNPYQPQYPAQHGYPAQPQQTQPQQNIQPYQQVAAGRPARIQQPAPARAPQPVQQGYAQPPQDYPPQQAYQGQHGYAPQQAYAPAQASLQPYQPPQQYAPARSNPITQPPNSYAPQPAASPFSQYDPSLQPTARPTAPPHRQVTGAPAGYAPQHYPPQAAPASHQYGQQPQSPPGNLAPWQSAQTPSIDPQGYDLGAYMPAPVQSQPQMPAPDWRTGRPTAPPAWSASQVAPPHDGGYAPMNALLETGLDHHGDGQEYDDEYENDAAADEAEFAPSRPRYGMILASIVVAFAIGGGLTYGYKVFAGRQEQVAGAPTVKSGADPFKVKPSDPGGTKFANTDAKVMDQLSGSDGGPRVVQTMKVERDGTITSGATSAPVPAAGAVPGMILVGGQQPASAAVPPASAAASILAASARPKAAVVAAAAPVNQPLLAAAAPPADEVPAPVSAAPVVKKVPKKPLAPAAGVGGPATAAVTGANGYVAVLASLPASGSSRMQAMQQFADLQQKYSDVLASKAPDVVEAKVADKGTFHRLVVGPPASRDSATAVCAKLKASGYTADCWVTAF